jgi:hypothetical protein
MFSLDGFSQLVVCALLPVEALARLFLAAMPDDSFRALGLMIVRAGVDVLRGGSCSTLMSGEIVDGLSFLSARPIRKPAKTSAANSGVFQATSSYPIADSIRPMSRQWPSGSHRRTAKWVPLPRLGQSSSAALMMAPVLLLRRCTIVTPADADLTHRSRLDKKRRQFDDAAANRG